MPLLFPYVSPPKPAAPVFPYHPPAAPAKPPTYKYVPPSYLGGGGAQASPSTPGQAPPAPSSEPAAAPPQLAPPGVETSLYAPAPASAFAFPGAQSAVSFDDGGARTLTVVAVTVGLVLLVLKIVKVF